MRAERPRDVAEAEHDHALAADPLDEHAVAHLG